jgi:hypothetical protein
MKTNYSDLPSQEEIDDYYDRKNFKRHRDLEQMFHMTGTAILWILIIAVLIGGCPFTPFVWMLIDYSVWVLIWLIVDVLLTIGLIWSLCAASTYSGSLPNDTIKDYDSK